jgi:hypothetical protein
MRKPRPIGPLSSLSQDQKQQLRAWYDCMTYEQIAAQIALSPPHGFALTVSVWQLRRYFQRLSLDDPSGPANAPSISAILDQVALSQPAEDIFTPATLHLLEKRSFELALAQADPQKISAVFGLVLKSRDTVTRERLAEVQRQKLALRRQPAVPTKSSAAPVVDATNSTHYPQTHDRS